MKLTDEQIDFLCKYLCEGKFILIKEKKHDELVKCLTDLQAENDRLIVQSGEWDLNK